VTPFERRFQRRETKGRGLKRASVKLKGGEVNAWMETVFHGCSINKKLHLARSWDNIDITWCWG